MQIVPYDCYIVHDLNGFGKPILDIDEIGHALMLMMIYILIVKEIFDHQIHSSG